jgi:hypothetical protein
LDYLDYFDLRVWANKVVSEEREVEAVAMRFFGFIEIVEAYISLHHQGSITTQHLSDISIMLEIFECRV